jgi:hypothetical protein
VQIDDKLGGKAVQHREVQDFESEKFLELFSPGIRIMQGRRVSFLFLFSEFQVELILLSIKWIAMPSACDS